MIHHALRHHHHAPPLHKRLFLWFAVIILVTAGIVGAAMRLTSRESGWRKEVDRARTYVAHRFAESWDDPQATLRVARAFSDDLDLDLVVRDPAGSVIMAVGQPCLEPHATVPVTRAGQVVGKVDFCMSRHHAWSPWATGVPILVGLLTLWLGTGLIARRLLRPLRVLSSAADEIGKGKLSTRVKLPPHSFCEARLLGGVMDEMTARIEKQLADQRALLGAVSHEIRTPLARMRLLAELAREQGCSAKTADELDREITEVDALVGDLLASSRIDFGARSSQRLEVRDLAVRAAEQAGMDPSKIEADAAELEGDATLLLRALTNLIDNARVHAEGAEVLRATVREDSVCFEVEDRGPGLEPGEEEKIFEPFYRKARGAEGTGTGVGLGLALVRRIAEAHGGKAFARNREGGGAVVGIEIPR